MLYGFKPRPSKTVLEIPIYEFTEKQLVDLINSKILEDRKMSVDAILSVVGIVLHDKKGFKRKRVNQMWEWIGEQFACVAEGHVKVTEINNELRRLNIIK
jgi:hypothetical protein